MSCKKDHAGFLIVRNKRIKKMVGKRSTDSSLETFDKHQISYYDVFDTMYNKLPDNATSFKNINDIFGFSIIENLQ